MMDSGMIGKIQKAKHYAQTPERFHFENFTITVNGTNTKNTIRYEDGNWNCTCSFFQSRKRCSHTMALEKILEQMLT